MSKEFSKKIYVTIKGEEGNEYFNITDESAEQFLTTTDLTKVATYELVEVKEGRLEPVFSAILG